MIKKERELQFRDYINACMNKDVKELIGLGNPYAKILLVGQESAKIVNIGEENKQITEDNNNFITWLTNKNFEYLYHQPRFYQNRLKKNGKPILNCTWNAYQKLIDYIRPEEKRCMDKKGDTDFCMDAFTTELNNTLSPHCAQDWKPRIESFKCSSFIKGFPVVILACSHYINEKQIIETFVVEPGDEHNYSKNTRAMRFKTYHSIDRSRLVLHTRQLSQYSDALLRGMAEEIQKHFNEIGESYFW